MNDLWVAGLVNCKVASRHALADTIRKHNKRCGHRSCELRGRLGILVANAQSLE